MAITLFGVEANSTWLRGDILYTTSELWKRCQSQSVKEYEYKIVIGGEDYLMDSIESLSIERSLCGDSAFSLGNVYASKLSLSIIPHNTPIPRMASVIPYVRMSGVAGHTEWVPLGVFYIDTRKKQGVRLILECYDKALMMDVPFIVEGQSLEYPLPMTEALSYICSRLGVSMTNMETINKDFSIEYPNNFTMREVAGFIASANAGNFTFDYDGNLKLVVPSNSVSVANVSVSSVDVLDETTNFRCVTILYSATDAFSSGGGYEMVLSNPWATQAMADYVLSKLSQYYHVPFEANQAYIDPTIELGDTVKIDGADYVLYSQSVKYHSHITASLFSPGGTTIDHEYPYTGSVSRAVDRTSDTSIQLGEKYYGVSIGRDRGLHIQKVSDVGVVGEAVFNSDLLTMRAWIDGEMRDCIYFDPVAGKYRLSGDVVIDGSVSSEATITDALYAEQGDISQLTVDRVETSDKIKRYLNDDPTPLHFIRIEGLALQFIIANVAMDGKVPQTEQLVSRYGYPVWWQKDISVARIEGGYPYVNGERVYTTEEDTGYPVMVYKYNEGIARQIYFEHDASTGFYFCTETFGQGSGVSETTGKTQNQGFMQKSDTSFFLKYRTSKGKEIGIQMNDDGYTDISGLRKTTGLNFADWDNGKFYESVSGGVDPLEYSVEFNANGDPVRITDPNGNQCTITW